MHKRYSAIALCCAAVAIAGCGGSGSSGSGTNKLVGNNSPSLAVFRTDLGGLCTAGNAAAKKAAPNPAKILAVINRYLPQFKSVTAPPQVQGLYSKFLANLEAEVAALRSGNGAAFRADAAKNAALARQLGVPACSHA